MAPLKNTNATYRSTHQQKVRINHSIKSFYGDLHCTFNRVWGEIRENFSLRSRYQTQPQLDMASLGNMRHKSERLIKNVYFSSCFIIFSSYLAFICHLYRHMCVILCERCEKLTSWTQNCDKMTLFICKTLNLSS